MPPRRTRSYLRKEIAYPSVDADGTVYWVAHAYGDDSAVTDSSMRSRVRRAPCSGRTTTAYAAGAAHRLLDAECRPEHGRRRQPGHERRDPRIREDRRDATRPRPLRPTAAVRRARSSLKNGVVIFTNTGEYGYGIMVPDASVRLERRFRPPTRSLPARRSRPAAASPASAPTTASTFPARSPKDRGDSWNLASFDCTNLTASSKKTPKWSVEPCPTDSSSDAAHRSAPTGTTLYIVADAATPSAVYALQHLERFHPSGRITLDAALQQCSGGGQPRTGACRHRDRTTTSCCRADGKLGLRRTDRRHRSRVRSRSPSGATPTCWAKTLRRASSRSTRWRCRA